MVSFHTYAYHGFDFMPVCIAVSFHICGACHSFISHLCVWRHAVPLSHSLSLTWPFSFASPCLLAVDISSVPFPGLMPCDAVSHPELNMPSSIYYVFWRFKLEPNTDETRKQTGACRMVNDGVGVLNASTDTDNGAWTDCVLRPISQHFDSWCWHFFFYNFFNTGLCLCSVGQNKIFYLTLI